MALVQARVRILLIALLLALAGCGTTAGQPEVKDRLVAINAQLDAISDDVGSFLADLQALVDGYGGRLLIPADRSTVEMRVPVERWADAFAEVRRRPEVTGGERVWGQDITDQVAGLTNALESAVGEDRELVLAKLAFRTDRVANAVIVVRLVG